MSSHRHYGKPPQPHLACIVSQISDCHVLEEHQTCGLISSTSFRPLMSPFALVLTLYLADQRNHRHLERPFPVFICQSSRDCQSRRFVAQDPEPSTGLEEIGLGSLWPCAIPNIPGLCPTAGAFLDSGQHSDGFTWRMSQGSYSLDWYVPREPPVT